MIHIGGIILTVHPDAACCGAAVTPDNHGMILTTLTERGLESTVSGTNLRSIIATVDDYLMNLGVAEETCLYDSH